MARTAKEDLIAASNTDATTAAALAALRRMSFAVVDAADRDAIHLTLAAELHGVFGVDTVHLCEVSEDRASGHGTAYGRGPDGNVEAGDAYEVPFDRPTGVGRVLETGQPLNVTDAPHSPVVSNSLRERFNAASLLYVPLTYSGVVRAVIVLLSETPRWFREEEIEFAYTMANQASAGLSALDMRSRLAEQADRQSALARAASALNEHLDRRAVLDTLCREATVALGADISGVYLGNAIDGGVAVAANGIDIESAWWGYKIAPGEGVAGQVLSTGEPAVTNDYHGDLRVPEIALLAQIKTALAVPMFWNGELRGSLSLAFFSERPVEQGDIETLQAIASLAAVACQNAEAFEEATEAARTDSLTGLLNHGAIQMRTSEEIWRSQRGDRQLACLLADLDNFKPINDQHGHLIGDEILKRVATALAEEFRPYDGIARYGGDEFVVLLPDADEADALAAAERLRACVSRGAANFTDLGMPLSVSVGVAQWTEPQTAGELLGRADRALLLAKRRGKGAIVVASARAELELAESEGGQAPSEFMNEFWDTVASCEEPREVLFVLPAFLLRQLGLEEVALYDSPRDSVGGALERLSHARVPGDPGAMAFGAQTLPGGGEVMRRVGAGSISRASLAELKAALGLEPGGSPEIPKGSYAAVGMARAGEGHGVLLLRHAAPVFPITCLRLVQIVAGQTVTVLAGQGGSGSRAAVAALAAAIDARDNYTSSHSKQVVELAGAVAKRLGLSDAQISQVRDGAMLHDVGKVAIPNEILNKRGPLDDAEWAVMREHPVIGEQILLRTPELAAIAPLVRHEHERWDGAGCPDGLAGEAIPIGSRIILACDAYNAMMTARPYREPLEHAEAVTELRRAAGTQFDPVVVGALLHELRARARVPAVVITQ